MSDELNVIVQVLDKVGTFGVLVGVILALIKGWAVPASTLAKIETERESYQKEIVELRKETITILKCRITDLERLISERETRVEQGVQMLSMFVEAQDTLTKLAEHISEGG